MEYVENSKKLNEVSDKIIEFTDGLDEIISLNEEQLELNEINQVEKTTVNYDDYLVDRNVVHSLYENFTYKRPCGFQIEEKRFEIKDWKEMLIKVCNYLSEKDIDIIKSFPDNPKVNGKKVIYFSRVKLPTMQSVKKLDCGIYLATVLSSNSIRNLII